MIYRNTSLDFHQYTQQYVSGYRNPFKVLPILHCLTADTAQVKHGEKKIQHFNESDQNKFLAAKVLHQFKRCE